LREGSAGEATMTTLPTLPDALLDLIAVEHPQAVETYRRERGLTTPAPEPAHAPAPTAPPTMQERGRKRRSRP
jgi:hypothetical protein